VKAERAGRSHACGADWAARIGRRGLGKQGMIDNLSIFVSHGLLILAFWRLVHRPDVDREDPPMHDAEPSGLGTKRRAAGSKPDA